jgi:PKD repeat protein
MAALAICAIATGCTMKSQEAPPLTGPSELGLSITVSVDPDLLVLDGSSQARVTIKVRDSNGRIPSKRISLLSEIIVDGVHTDYGALSQRNLVTDLNTGEATLVYTAPAAPAGPSVDTNTTVNIEVTPYGTDFGNSVSRVATIRLVPSGTVVPADGLAPHFTMSTNSVTDHQAVAFTACSDPEKPPCAPPSNPVARYSWDFGDGRTGSGRNASHSYDTAGVYVVMLSIADGYNRTATTTQTVEVTGGTTPTAAVVFSPAAPAVGQDVNFNAAGSRPAPGRTIRTYAWDFGDGTLKTTTTATTSHDFTAAGNYIVTLVVTDDAGRVGTTTASVTVTGGASAGQVATPNVVGLTQAAATTALTTAGLSATVTPVSNSAPVGTVIFQNPVAGTLVATGSSVAISVSVGP